MAEVVGFEPTRALTPCGFQDRPLQPLGYTSKKMVVQGGIEPPTLGFSVQCSTD